MYCRYILFVWRTATARVIRTFVIALVLKPGEPQLKKGRHEAVQLVAIVVSVLVIIVTTAVTHVQYAISSYSRPILRGRHDMHCRLLFTCLLD